MESITAADLLTKAEEFERLAQAYRTVAMGMNGRRPTTKRVVSLIDGAIELRHEAKIKKQARPKQTRPSKTTMAERKEFLRTQLATDGPLSTNQLRDRVAHEEGFDLSRDRVYQVLRDMKDVRLRGERANATWHLKAAKRAASAKKKTTRKVVKVAKRTKMTRATKPVKRGDKGRVIVEVLQARGPLTVADLNAAVRERGIEGLTGIHNYVKQGLISRRGKSPRTWVYDFKKKRIPPAATTTVEAAATANDAPAEDVSAS